MAISTLYFVLSDFVFGVGFGCSSPSFVQVKNNNGGLFLLDKNVNSIPKKSNQHIPFIVLARNIDIEQVLMRIIREDTYFYFDLGKKVVW